MLELAVSVQVPFAPGFSEMLAALSELVRPEGGTVALRATEPTKPLRLVSEMVAEAPGVFTAMLRLAGFAVMLKSVTFTTTTVEWESEPLAPVTVTV